jgi:hypothetical protein
MSLRTCCKSGLPIIGGGSPGYNQFDNVGFYVWRASAQTVTGTPVSPNFSAKVEERPSGAFDLSTNSFTAVRAGRYVFSGGIELIMAAAGSAFVQIEINSVFQNSSSSFTSTPGTISVSHTAIFWLDIGDSVRIRMFQDSGTNASLVGSAYKSFFTGSSIFLV